MFIYSTPLLHMTSYIVTWYHACISDLLYSGRTNDLVAVQEWSLVILCHYDLAHYPFDTQRCPLSLVLAKYTSDLFVVRVRNYTFSGNRRHHQYKLRHISVANFTVDGYAGQRLMLVLRNQYIYYISAAYVPSCMLLVISYLTYHYNMEDFQTRISVALTSLLVLATLFSELVGGLPKTSYLKLIDIWFLGCIVANFFMVVCLVLIEKQRLWLASDPLSKFGSKEGCAEQQPLFQFTTSVKLSSKARQTLTAEKIRPTLPASGEYKLFNKKCENKEQVGNQGQASRLNSTMKIFIPITISVFAAAYSIGVIVIMSS